MQGTGLDSAARAARRQPGSALHPAWALQLDKEVQREKALAEAEGRTQERRQNKDIYRE